MKKIIRITIIALTVAILISCTSLYNNLLDEYGPSNLETVSTTTTSTNTGTSTSTSSDQGGNGSENNDPPGDSFSAPDFTVLDMDGNEVQLSSFLGKPIVLNFWATWCGYCVQEMPDFQTFYEKYPDVQFVMVNVEESASTVKSFIDQKGFTFPVFRDTDGSAAVAYGVNAYPYSFFINAEGELVAYCRGMISYSSLESAIKMITEE